MNINWIRSQRRMLAEYAGFKFEIEIVNRQVKYNVKNEDSKNVLFGSISQPIGLENQKAMTLVEGVIESQLRYVIIDTIYDIDNKIKNLERLKSNLESFVSGD